LTAFWSIKEGVLKALGKGLTIDTRKIIAYLSVPPWKFWSSQEVTVDIPGVSDVVAYMRCLGSYVLVYAVINKYEGKKWKI